MDERERLLAVLAVKAGFVDASAARLAAAIGPGLLQHLEQAGALTARRRELLVLFATEAATARGGDAAALHALLDPADPFPPATTTAAFAEDDDERTVSLGTRPGAKVAGLGDEDDEPGDSGLLLDADASDAVVVDSDGFGALRRTRSRHHSPQHQTRKQNVAARWLREGA